MSKKFQGLIVVAIVVLAVAVIGLYFRALPLPVTEEQTPKSKRTSNNFDLVSLSIKNSMSGPAEIIIAIFAQFGATKNHWVLDPTPEAEIPESSKEEDITFTYPPEYMLMS